MGAALVDTLSKERSREAAEACMAELDLKANRLLAEQRHGHVRDERRHEARRLRRPPVVHALLAEEPPPPPPALSFAACHSLTTESACIGAKDSRNVVASGYNIYEQPCNWCCGAACHNYSIG